MFTFTSLLSLSFSISLFSHPLMALSCLTLTIFLVSITSRFDFLRGNALDENKSIHLTLTRSHNRKSGRAELNTRRSFLHRSTSRLPSRRSACRLAPSASPCRRRFARLWTRWSKVIQSETREHRAVDDHFRAVRSIDKTGLPTRLIVVSSDVPGRKKKMKGILPLLIAAKVKMGILATLTYFVAGLLAKKAIFASLISLAISAFVGMKSLWGGKGGHDITAYSSGWNQPISGGWSGGGGGGGGGWSAPVVTGGWSNGGWDDGHAYAHGQAYSGHHH